MSVLEKLLVHRGLTHVCQPPAVLSLEAIKGLRRAPSVSNSGGSRISSLFLAFQWSQRWQPAGLQAADGGTCLSRGREGRKVVKEPEHEERTQSTRGPSHNRFEKKNTYALTPQKLRRQKKASERMSEAEQKPPQPTRKGDELDAGVCRTHAQAPPPRPARGRGGVLWNPREPWAKLRLAPRQLHSPRTGA